MCEYTNVCGIDPHGGNEGPDPHSGNKGVDPHGGNTA